jgi:hypothetical protein
VKPLLACLALVATLISLYVLVLIPYGPVRLGPVYLVRDTGIPNDYPPKARAEIVDRRMRPYIWQSCWKGQIMVSGMLFECKTVQPEEDR